MSSRRSCRCQSSDTSLKVGFNELRLEPKFLNRGLWINFLNRFINFCKSNNDVFFNLSKLYSKTSPWFLMWIFPKFEADHIRHIHNKNIELWRSYKIQCCSIFFLYSIIIITFIILIMYMVSHETWQYVGRVECRLDFWYNLLRLFVNLILEVNF